ncbi:MAG: hypothetical protein GTO00_09075 [Deltaproteobacteria bacterium]|nr:hypothetical protein [Deltaproteobacteria bacterium]
MKLTQFLLPMVQSGDPAQIDQAAGLLAQKGAVNPQQFLATVQAGNAPANLLGNTAKLPTFNPGQIALPQTPTGSTTPGTPPIIAEKETEKEKAKDLLTKLQELSAGISAPAAPVTPAPPAAPVVNPNTGVGGVGGINIEQILQQVLGRGSVPANKTFGQLLIGQ